MIRLGTSGFSYTDWVGTFYPTGTKKEQMLELYARRFDTVEINSTYYRLPGRKTFESFARRVGDTFRFSVKLPGDITHKAQLSQTKAFVEVLTPVVDAGKLGCVLAQFPHSFKNTEEHRRYLANVARALSSMPLVVEFRDSSWQIPAVDGFLKNLHVGCANVDEPALPGLMRPTERATSPLAYVRFHGRNETKWYQHERSEERYDYLYLRSELADWIQRVTRLEQEAEDVYIYFNNHASGKATTNAVDFKEMLRAR
jgi:uncharacterized protein YecE (DUF72 family)